MGVLEPEVAAAVTAARDEVLRAPRSAAAWGRLAMILFTHAQTEPAGPCLQEAERLDPNDPRWHYLTAQLRLMNDRAQAVPELERAAELAANSSVPRLVLAEVLAELGRDAEAESQFRRVLQREPANPRALLGLGRIASDRGDLAAGLDCLPRAAAKAPRVRAIHSALAEVYFCRGDSPAAERELVLAARAPGGPPWGDPIMDEVDRLQIGVDPPVALANQLLAAGRGPDAVAVLQKAAAKYPDSDTIRAALGRVLLRSGNQPAAEEALRAAVRLDPSQVSPLMDLGLALQQLGRHREAADCYRKVTTLNPHQAQAYFQLAFCLDQLNDRPGALAALRAAVRCKPDFADAHKAIGVLLADANQPAEAREHLENALRLNPGDEKVQAVLARVGAGTSARGRP